MLLSQCKIFKVAMVASCNETSEKNLSYEIELVKLLTEKQQKRQFY